MSDGVSPVIHFYPGPRSDTLFVGDFILFLFRDMVDGGESMVVGKGPVLVGLDCLFELAPKSR